MITPGLKRFYNTLEAYEADLEAGIIPEDAICFVNRAETIQIPDYPSGSDTASSHEQEFEFMHVMLKGKEGDLSVYGYSNAIFSINFDGEEEIFDEDPNLPIGRVELLYMHLGKLGIRIDNIEKTTAAMGVDLNKRLIDPLPVNTILATHISVGNIFGKNWLNCNGSKVYAEDYPDLLLRANSQGIITLPNIQDSNLSYYIKVSK